MRDRVRDLRRRCEPAPVGEENVLEGMLGKGVVIMPLPPPMLGDLAVLVEGATSSLVAGRLVVEGVVVVTEPMLLPTEAEAGNGRLKGILEMERWRRKEGPRSLLGDGRASRRFEW